MRRGALLVALVAGLVWPAAAHGACTLTLVVVPCIQVDFPASTLALGTVDAGTTTTSAEQVMTVSANVSWGLRVSADRTGGKMAEWTGSAYAASPKVLTDPLQWARTSLDGTPTASPSYAALGTSPAAVVTGRGHTGCVLNLLCGTDDVGVRFRQTTHFTDRRASPNSYRILVTYDAQTGF